MTRSILSSCGFRFLLFLVPGLKVMAKPLQTDLIVTPSNYIGSEFDLDDAGTSQILQVFFLHYPSNISSLPTHSNQLQFSIWGLMLTRKSISTLPVSIRVLRVFPFQDPFTAPVRRGLRGKNGPILPTAPLNLLTAALAIMRQRRISSSMGAALVCHFFLLLFSPLLFVAQPINVCA